MAVIPGHSEAFGGVSRTKRRGVLDGVANWPAASGVWCLGQAACSAVFGGAFGLHELAMGLGALSAAATISAINWLSLLGPQVVREKSREAA